MSLHNSDLYYIVSKILWKLLALCDLYYIPNLQHISEVIHKTWSFHLQAVGEVLAACCHLVPLAQEPLVSKVCQLIYNSVARQQVKQFNVL